MKYPTYFYLLIVVLISVIVLLIRGSIINSEELYAHIKQVYDMSDVIRGCEYDLFAANNEISDLNETIRTANDMSQYHSSELFGIKFQYGEPVSTSSCQYKDLL